MDLCNQGPKKVGDEYYVWWSTGVKDEDGNNVSRVLEIRPYKGAYPQWFTHIYKLTSETRRGWTEMTVNERTH